MLVSLYSGMVKDVNGRFIGSKTSIDDKLNFLVKKMLLFSKIL
jgi:hypothetical protein